MSKYFTLQELCKSDIAVENKIQNIPSFEVVQHLEVLALFLDGIREEWGSPIRVNSGFRCPELNNKVRGVSKSVHQIGYAADLVPVNGNINLFKQFIVNYLKDKSFHQCIIEKSGKSQWIHISLYGNKGEQNKMIFKIEK